LIVLFVGNDIYIANVGDCRAVLSEFNGNKVTNLSTDHKPNDERQRIEEAGGKVYQTNNGTLTSKLTSNGKIIASPFRAFPGKLSVKIKYKLIR